MSNTKNTASTEPLRNAAAPEPEVAIEPPTPSSDENEKTVVMEPDQHSPVPAPVPCLQVPEAPGLATARATDDDGRGRTTTQLSPNANLSSAHHSRAASPNASAIYPHTQVTYDDPDFTHPPPLNYSLRPRKKSIFFFWSLIFLDCVCMPIGLYFGMWYGLTRDQLSANAVFSISTALLGTVSIVEYFIRFRRLWRKNSNCRVIGAKRFYVSFFFFFFFFFLFIE